MVPVLDIDSLEWQIHVMGVGVLDIDSLEWHRFMWWVWVCEDQGLLICFYSHIDSLINLIIWAFNTSLCHAFCCLLTLNDKALVGVAEENQPAYLLSKQETGETKVSRIVYLYGWMVQSAGKWENQTSLSVFMGFVQ